MLCQAAHFRAAAEGQTRARVPSLSAAFFLQEDAHVDSANDVDDEPAVGRVSGDSHCSGPSNPPLSLSAFLASPLTQIASYLQINRQIAVCSTCKLVAEVYLSFTNGFMAHPRVRLVLPLCFHRCSDRQRGRAHSIYCTIIGWRTDAAIGQPARDVMQSPPRSCIVRMLNIELNEPEMRHCRLQIGTCLSFLKDKDNILIRCHTVRSVSIYTHLCVFDVADSLK